MLVSAVQVGDEGNALAQDRYCLFKNRFCLQDRGHFGTHSVVRRDQTCSSQEKLPSQLASVVKMCIVQLSSQVAMADHGATVGRP
jgi:hypothetical protein